LRKHFLNGLGYPFFSRGGFGGGIGGSMGCTNLSDCVRIGAAIEALVWAALGGYAACYFASGRGSESNPNVAGS
jgi:hypothetical protein